MFASPRPVRRMPAASTAFGPPAGARLSGALLRWVPVLPGCIALRRAARLPLALAPLAFAAVALPAHAAHRAAPAAAHVAPAAAHAAAHAQTHRAAATTTASHSRQTSAHFSASARATSTVVAAARRGRHAAEEDKAPVAKDRYGRTVAANRTVSSRERRQTETVAHRKAFAELWDRAGQREGRHAAETRETARTETAHSETPRAETSRETSRVTNRLASAAGRASDAGAAADGRTEERVHAWYRSRHPGNATDESESETAETRPANLPAPVHSPTVAAAAHSDLSTAAPKATSADFAHAAAVQRDTIAAAHEQQAHQTTADDDNADAETRIPSTAPTERVPAPFVHGSFGEGAAPAAEVPAAGQAQRQGAPIVRQSPAQTAAIQLAPPQHVDLKHRGDGLSTALAAEAARSSNPAAAKSPIPVATAADSSPRAIRALAQQTAASPTPVLKLPAPPSGALKKELPAVAAVESGARHRELDPAVTSGMAEETFDQGGAPATARTAVALAAPNPVAGLVPTRTHATTAAEDGDASLPAAAVVSVNLFDRQGHLILVPPMKGSHEILVHQNEMAVADGLLRIQDDGDLSTLRQRKLLVSLPDEDSTYPDDRLPANRRYARPWTVRFLRDLAKAHYQRFGTPLIVTSAARTVEFQRHLVRVNGNAAPPTGDIASPHLYGQAIDIGKGHMGLTELTWMRAYLTPVENDGKIDVEEEFQQSCFHISVYRRYLGLPSLRQTAPASQTQLLTAKQSAAPEETKPAEKKRRRISTALLATGLR